MRCQTWDVALLPGVSFVPLQEFGVKCQFVPLPDQGRNQTYCTHFRNLGNDDRPEVQGAALQYPLLTAFVPSLEWGNPFRISVRSWESSKLAAEVSGLGHKVAHEVRVYIDGSLLGRTRVAQDTAGPQIIDSVHSASGRSITALRFCPFRGERRIYPSGDAEQVLGRIRVELSEILICTACSEHFTSTRTARYVRSKTLVAFSFEHAALAVLQSSGIAWPDFSSIQHLDTMSFLASRFRVARPPSGASETSDHVHLPLPTSPRDTERVAGSSTTYTHSTNSARLRSSLASYRGLPSLPNHNNAFTVRAPPESLESRSPHSNGSDVSMPDYASLRTSRSRGSSEMSSVSYPRVDFVRTMNEAAVDEIVGAMHPLKRLELLSAVWHVLAKSTSAPFRDL